MLVSISIVSHGQSLLVVDLLRDLASLAKVDLEVLLTLNIPESLTIDLAAYPFRMTVINNAAPKGFAANHNQAFRSAHGDYFCVLNPDVRLISCPFAALLDCLNNPAIGVVAPQVLSPSGHIEDSARRFPSPGKIFAKLFGNTRPLDYPQQHEAFPVDWVGGMFMLFPRQIYQDISGFDERFFLYYEDVDLCARLCLARLQCWLCPVAQVVHDAQRSSHRRLKYLAWHLRSMLRFFLSPVYRQLKQLQRL
jgi:GT2 family glycosyltransferase